LEKRGKANSTPMTSKRMFAGLAPSKKNRKILQKKKKDSSMKKKLARILRGTKILSGPAGATGRKQEKERGGGYHRRMDTRELKKRMGQTRLKKIHHREEGKNPLIKGRHQKILVTGLRTRTQLGVKEKRKKGSDEKTQREKPNRKENDN